MCCRCADGDLEVQNEIELPFVPATGMYILSQKLKPFTTVIVEGIAWNDDYQQLLIELQDHDSRSQTRKEVDDQSENWTTISTAW